MREKFIIKANIVHHNKYDYSLVEYKNNKLKVKIICPIHGIFEQRPDSHLQGKSCKKCGYKKLLTTETNNQFIEKANKIHNCYDYSLVEYKNNSTKVKIICHEHGIFEQTPQKHLNGQGCKKCSFNKNSLNLRLSNNKFLEKAKEIHGVKYDYSLVEYKNNSSKVKIICKNHGVFEQIPNSHLLGNGCKKCGYEQNSYYFTSNTNDFIIKANKIHRNKYDYSLVEYVNAHTKIKIICHDHGIFEQAPNNHLMGNKCPKCSYISKPEGNWLESFNNLNIIRNKSIRLGKCKIKPDGYDPITNTIYEFYGDYWHGNPNKYNQSDINKNNKKTFGMLYEETLKKERLIKKAGYNLITIWESDWKNYENK